MSPFESRTNHPVAPYRATYVSLSVGILLGLIGGSAMFAVGSIWGPLLSCDKGVLGSMHEENHVVNGDCRSD